MDDCRIYLVEGGFPQNLPGFSRATASASFPFWGSYCFLDFSASCARGLGGGFTLIAESRFRALPAFISSRGQEQTERLLSVEDGIIEFIEILRAEPAEIILLCPLSLVCDPDVDALRAEIESLSADIVKLSLNNAAVDIYIARRKALIEALERHSQRNTASSNLSKALFSESLHTSFEAMRGIPGTVFFQNSLMQLYNENLRLIAGVQNAALSARLNGFQSKEFLERDIRIEKGGEVSDSLLAPGVRVEGCVKGSLLFPDVVVHKGAAVVDSVVMNANHIGSKAQVYKTLILPYSGDNGKGFSNIGENAVIGVKQSSARNFDFPNQIQKGVTVIGESVHIPKGYKIGPGCLVGADMTIQQLRPIKELKKSTSVFRQDDPRRV